MLRLVVIAIKTVKMAAQTFLIRRLIETMMPKESGKLKKSITSCMPEVYAVMAITASPKANKPST